MDTLVSLFGALARGVRWTFDLAGMAVGIAPATDMRISDAATMPGLEAAPLNTSGGAVCFDSESFDGLDWHGVATNPSTGLPMAGVGYSTVDVAGNLYGTN
jgi:hypothetical protein